MISSQSEKETPQDPGSDISETYVVGAIRWDDIESLLLACGARIEERAGSRLGIWLNGVRAHAHRPHPRQEASRGAVESIRRFLQEAGIEHDEI